MSVEEKEWLMALSEDVAAIKSALEAATKLIPAPDWFVQEFGSADLNGLILDPKLSIEGWRTLAIALRTQGKGIGYNGMR